MTASLASLTGCAPAILAGLDALRRTGPDCRLVAYCDLEARLVLRHAAVPEVRQELLDQLSAEAEDAFALRHHAARLLPPALMGQPADVEEIRLIDDRGTRLFLRNPALPQDALILLCASPAGAEALLPPARRFLLGAMPTGLS